MSIQSLSTHNKWARWLVFVFAVLLYLPSLGYDFTQDDAIVIYENDYVKKGFAGLGDIFSSDSFSGFFGGADKSQLVSGGRYRPLTLGLFAVVYEVAGETPWVYHLLAVLSYGLLCFLLYRVLIGIHTSWLQEHQALFALTCTLLYAAHPIHTEVVANVKGLDETLSFLFSLLAFQATLSFIKKRSTVDALCSPVFLFLAILSKESAAPMVVLIPLFAYLLSGAKEGKRTSSLKITGFFSITFMTYWLLRSTIIGSGIGVAPLELMNNPFIKIVDGQYLAFTSEEKWASIIYGLGKYIQLLFFPHPLTHDYYPRHFGVVNFRDLTVWLSLIMNAMLVLIALLGIKKRSMISLIIIFFYATIFLTSNILFVRALSLCAFFIICCDSKSRIFTRL